MEERPEASTIYIPTEANMPILEATRLQKPVKVTLEKKDDES